MASDQEILFHRTFLSLDLALKIWNEDYNHQNSPGGKPPNRQSKIDSDPLYAYHVQQGPPWPHKAPGDPASSDKKYNALLARSNGSLESLVIVTKRGMSGQDFASVATPWEKSNSVMCGGKFNPVVNEMMEVTGHSAKILDYQLIRPAGVFSYDSGGNPRIDIEDDIKNGVPLMLWLGQMWDSGGGLRGVPPSEGWETYGKYSGGIDVAVLPNGEVRTAVGHLHTSNNGHAISTISPLDFWTPGQRLVASAIRKFTDRISSAAVKGFSNAIKAPTKQLAESTVARLAPKTLPGVAVPTPAVLPAQTIGKRTLLLADDMDVFKPYLSSSTAEAGWYDIVIHGSPESFYILQNGVWKTVSVKEVANIVRPLVGKNDKIRLLACESASRGGPAQELANELKLTVWAPSKSVYPVKGVPIKDANGKVIKFNSAKSFVPDGGKFYQFDPAGGSTIMAGPGRQVNQHVVKRKK